jgi:hypothetical protein
VLALQTPHLLKDEGKPKMTYPTDPSVRDALQELVAVKALKDRMETLTDPTVKAPMTAAEVDEYNALRAEYAGRKPIAWANARAALSKQEASTPAIPSDVPRLHDFIRRESGARD